MSYSGDNPIDPQEAAELRRSLSSEPDAHADPAGPEMTRDEALLRLADQLPDGAFASVHLQEVAITNRDIATDIRAGRPARFHREWSVLITAPGYAHNHGGDQLGPVVEQALKDFFASRAQRDAEEWARAAVPGKPPKLAAPGTAEQTSDERAKDAG